MWEWLMNELKKIVYSLRVNRTIVAVGEDDIVMEIMLYLWQDKDLAEEIYQNKKIGLLYHMAKKEIYECKSKQFFDNKMQFSWWQRVKEVCDKYNIEMRPENAYKVAAILEETSPNFNISGIASLLSMDNPLNNGFTTKEGYLEEYKEFNEQDIRSIEFNENYETGQNVAAKSIKDKKQYKIYL